jgi:hypothetical protein
MLYYIQRYRLLSSYLIIGHTPSTPSLDDPPMQEVLDPIDSARNLPLSIPDPFHSQ